MDSKTNNKEVAEVKCGTSTGDITIEFHRSWSPHGYDRAVDLFERGFYDHSHFFRTVPGFLVQFGISYSQSESLQALAKTHIPDDPQQDPPVHFTVGTISYAGSGPNSRTSQLFFSLMPNGGGFGRELWETPVGKVVSGIENVKAFYSEYGDMPPWGKGPVQQNIHSEGRKYIDENFPLLSHFTDCKVERLNPDGPAPVQEKVDPVIEKNAHQPLEPKKGIDHINSPSKPHLHADQRHRQPDQQPTLRKPKEPRNLSDHHSSNNIEHVTGQLHHQHGVHLNSSQEEEGLTKLSWELMGGCVVLFLGVFVLWLRFAFSMSRKSRKTS